MKFQESLKRLLRLNEPDAGALRLASAPDDVTRLFLRLEEADAGGLDFELNVALLLEGVQAVLGRALAGRALGGGVVAPDVEVLALCPPAGQTDSLPGQCGDVAAAKGGG